MPDHLQRMLQSSITHLLFAFIVMGSWAIFANWPYPFPRPYIAGLVQGVLSATITYLLKRTIERLAIKCTGISALWAPPLIACSISLCILVTIHFAAGTPEVIRTISLPFSVATIYAVIYNYSLWNGRSTNNDQ